MRIIHRIVPPKKWDIYLLFILFLPIMQLFLNRNLFVTPLGAWIDPWVYTGYFLDLPDYLQEFGGTYYGSRLPWILPGYFFHSFLPPLLANYTLHLIFYYALLISTYCLVKNAADKTAGLLASILMAWNPGILMAIGWDYIDGAGIVFIMSTMLCCEQAVKSEAYWAWLFFTGVFLACVVFTNLFLVVLIPVFTLQYWLRNHAENRKPMFISFVSVLSGILLTALTLGLFNKSLGGSFLFFMPSVQFAISFSKQISPYMPTNHTWILRAFWLVLPLVTCVGALLFILKERWRLRQLNIDVFLMAQLNLLFASAIWLFCQSQGQPVLAINYYVSYLLPFSIVSLTLQVWGTGISIGHKSKMMLFCIAFLLLAAPHIFDPNIALGSLYSLPVLSLLSKILPSNLSYIDFFRTLLALIAATLALLGAKIVKYQALRLGLFLSCMSMFYAITYYSGIAVQPAGALNSPKGFKSVVEAHRFIQMNSEKRRLCFWYDASNNLGSITFRGIASTYLWGYRLFNEEFPRISNEQAALLSSNKRLVLLLSDDDDINVAQKALLRFRIKLALVAHQQFAIGDTTYSVTLFDIEPFSITPADVGADPDEAIVLFSATWSRLQQILQQNIYSPKKKQTVSVFVRKNDMLAFYPTTKQDHLATPFIRLASREQGEMGQLYLYVEMDFPNAVTDSGKTLVILQDQNYNSRMELSSPFKDSQKKLFGPITSDVTSIRILFMGEPGIPCHLPDKLVVSEMRGTKQ